MKVLSHSSVEHLRSLVREGRVDLLSLDADKLASDAQVKFVDLSHDVGDVDVRLAMPTGDKQEQNMDKDNCIKIWNAMSNLTANQATDERLWLTICLLHQKEYGWARWGKDELDDASKNKIILNHWFAKTSRDRIRNNVLSRLWWTAKIVNRLPNMKQEEALDILLQSSDYRVQLLDRTTSASSAVVVEAVLNVSKKAASQGKNYNRDGFRDFLAEVSFIGKRNSLPTYDVTTLENYLLPKYLDTIDNLEA